MSIEPGPSPLPMPCGCIVLAGTGGEYASRCDWHEKGRTPSGGEDRG